MDVETEQYIINISGFSSTTTKDMLLSAFRPFGEIKNIELPYDLNTHKLKGYCQIEYEEYDDCVHAIDNMNLSEFGEKIIQVSFAKKKKNIN